MITAPSSCRSGESKSARAGWNECIHAETNRGGWKSQQGTWTNSSGTAKVSWIQSVWWGPWALFRCCLEKSSPDVFQSIANENPWKQHCLEWASLPTFIYFKGSILLWHSAKGKRWTTTSYKRLPSVLNDSWNWTIERIHKWQLIKYLFISMPIFLTAHLGVNFDSNWVELG